MLKIRLYISLCIALIQTNSITAQPIFHNTKTSWADSLLNTMTLEEKIGQLFMVAAYSNKPETHEQHINKLIKDYHLGGLIFFQGTPKKQAQLTNRYQKLAKIPLMIAIDGEWGLSMRLDSTLKFPWQMTLGAIQNDTLIYKMGQEIARQCKRLGIHINFAPVVDINNNPNNPVINARSFGEDKLNVARKGIAYMKGMQDLNVLACAKHFPGHGDTDKDSHKALPSILHTKERLKELELVPFDMLIKAGVGSIMVAHLFIPALDDTPNLATTLSKKVVTNLLKDSLKFQGLIFTDALNMKGVANFNAPGIVDVKALMAGNDVLLYAEDVPKAILEIKKAIQNRELTEEDINQRCLKILKAKEWMGLNKYQPINLKNLNEDLNTNSAKFLIRQVTEASITVLKNDDDLLPLKNLDTLSIASVSIGSSKKNKFQATLDLYTKITHFNTSDNDTELEKITQQLKQFNTIIISLHQTKDNPFSSYTVPNNIKQFIANIDKNKKVILCLFTNPYALNNFSAAEAADAIIVSYQNNDDAQDLTAQLIFGGIQATGTLPVSAGNFKVGQGITTSSPIRLKYTVPEELNFKQEGIENIKKKIHEAIKDKVFPGCQILIAQKGKVFFNEAFGNHTYANNSPRTKTTDIYDMASVTKVVATLPIVMQLVSEGKINIDSTLATYNPQWATTNKGKIVIREMLAHQAGLKPWIPFYTKTLDKNKKPDPQFYSTQQSTEYPHQVAKNLFIRKDMPDSLLQTILNSELTENRKYVYSDLGYFFLKVIIERLVGKGIDDYLYEKFYYPLGMNFSGYNPHKWTDSTTIVPTEKDDYFRYQLLHGYVHDQAAAIMGGVAGHAGIFSNANDMAKIMQLYLQKGTYGGKKYFKKSVIEEFTKCQFCANENRRGLGFDKPQMDYSKSGPTCKCVSYLSFGHTGFTGTMVWVDPEKEIIYIFISNRVHPTASNDKINTQGIRQAIQKIIYESIE